MHRNRLAHLVLIFSLYGCSTFEAREANGVGHPFIATQQAGNSFVEYNSWAAIVFPLLIISLPLTVFDLGVSMATDTIMLPVDLIDMAVEPDQPNREINRSHIRM